MITLIQLEYAVAVDTYRHFAKAAERCFVSQPTLSMQLKKMEDELEIILFDRSRQPVIPTDPGKLIIEQARIILQESKKLDLIAKEIKEKVTGELRIGIIPTIAPYLLPLFAGKFKQKYPHLHLKIQEVVTEQIEEMLQKDQLDVGILVTPLHNPIIFELPLYYEEMMIYSNPAHQLVSKPVIEIQDIATPDIWLLSDGHCFRHQVINLCDLHHLDSDALPFEFEGGSLETMMKIIDREGGFTLIPELTGLEIQNQKADHLRHFTNIKPLREVSLVYSRQYTKIKIIELLSQSIKKAVPDIMMDKTRGIIVEWK